ncbi:MAG: hypothetical protein HYZ29_34235 [Myxococcales bacterium]|nr:hypothetical protein [Myxococcales bacterium]
MCLLSSACAASAGPSTTTDASPQIVITDAAKVDGAVGALVTLVGVQTRTKWPTVLGADVDGDYAMSDKRVRVTGRIEKHLQAGPPMVDGAYVQGRAAGSTSYRIVDPKTGALAKPSLD